MKSTMKPFGLSSLVISQEQLAPRSSGVHVSQIVRKLSRAMGKRDGDFTDEQLDRFAIVGRLWEKLLAEALFKPPQYVRPGEIELDEVIGSPDCVDTEHWSVFEFKCTWRSYKDFEGTDHFWKYRIQLESYCAMLGMCRARLVVLFVCGNWRDDPVPRAIEWDLLFTPQEIAEHWRMILANK